MVRLFLFLFLLITSAAAAPTVNLGSAINFAILANTAITTGTTTDTATGSIGIYPNTASSITGSPPITLTNGNTYAAGGTSGANITAAQAQVDATTAYNYIKALTPTNTSAYMNLGGLILAPGIYSFGSSTGIAAGVLTLDYQNNSNSNFIFQITSTLITTGATSVVEINKPSNVPSGSQVFWQVGTSATLCSGSTCSFIGNVIANAAIGVTYGLTLQNGSLLALGTSFTISNGPVSIISNAPSSFLNTSGTTIPPTTPAPTTLAPTTAAPTNASTTSPPTTLAPTTGAPSTTLPPTTSAPTNASTTIAPTTALPTTLAPTTITPTTITPTTIAPTTALPTTSAPTTTLPTTLTPVTTVAPTTSAPTTSAPTTPAPTSPPITTNNSILLNSTFNQNYSSIINTTTYCNYFLGNLSALSGCPLTNLVCLNVTGNNTTVIQFEIITTAGGGTAQSCYTNVIGNITSLANYTSSSLVCNSLLTYASGTPCYVLFNPPTSPPITGITLNATFNQNYTAITNTTIYCNNLLANISTLSGCPLSNFLCLNVSNIANTSIPMTVVLFRIVSTTNTTADSCYNNVIGNLTSLVNFTSDYLVCNPLLVYATGTPCYTLLNPTTIAPTTLPPTTVPPTTLPPTTAAPTNPPVTTNNSISITVTQNQNYSLIANTTVYCNNLLANISTLSGTPLANLVCLNVSSGSVITTFEIISTAAGGTADSYYNYVIGNLSSLSNFTSYALVCNSSITYTSGTPCYALLTTTTVAPTTVAPTTVAPTTTAPTTSAPTNASTTAAPAVFGSVLTNNSIWTTVNIVFVVILGIAAVLLPFIFCLIGYNCPVNKSSKYQQQTDGQHKKKLLKNEDEEIEDERMMTTTSAKPPKSKSHLWRN